MSKIEITIDSKVYPCRQTMGAMVRYKKETGKEVTALGNNLTDMCAYLYCCVASASAHDKVKFDMSFLDFADSLTPEDLNAWVTSISGNTAQTDDGEDGEKKS